MNNRKEKMKCFLVCSLLVSVLGLPLWADTVQLNPSSDCPPMTEGQLGGNFYPEGLAQVQTAYASFNVGGGSDAEEIVENGTDSVPNCLESAFDGGSNTVNFTYEKGTEWSVGGSLAGEYSAVLATIEAKVEGKYGQKGVTTTSVSRQYFFNSIPACTRREITYKYSRKIINFDIDVTRHCVYRYYVKTGEFEYEGDTIDIVEEHTKEITTSIGGISGSDKRASNFNAVTTPRDFSLGKSDCPDCKCGN